MSRRGRWLRQGLRVGLAAGVLLIWPIPTLLFGYPLVLLPLLLAGPLAVSGFRGRRALGAALVAGCVSGALGTAALVFAVQVLNAGVWGLTARRR